MVNYLENLDKVMKFHSDGLQIFQNIFLKSIKIYIPDIKNVSKIVFHIIGRRTDSWDSDSWESDTRKKKLGKVRDDGKYREN